MEIRYGLTPREVNLLTNEEIRKELTFKDFFVNDAIKYIYTHVDRTIIGGAMPQSRALCFDNFIDAENDLGCEYPLESREMACINIGGEGYMVSDGERYEIGNTTDIYLCCQRKQKIDLWKCGSQ